MQSESNETTPRDAREVEFERIPTTSGMVKRVLRHMTREEVAAAIMKNHPVELDTDECYEADTLAMELIHGRHDKREIVNLIRWCLMGCPQ